MVHNIGVPLIGGWGMVYVNLRLLLTIGLGSF